MANLIAISQAGEFLAMGLAICLLGLLVVFLIALIEWLTGKTILK